MRGGSFCEAQELAGIGLGLCRIAAVVEDGRAGDEEVRSGFDDFGDGVISDAAVDFDAVIQAHLGPQRGQMADFLHAARNEALAAEAWVDRHDQHVMHQRQHLNDGLHGRGRVDHDRRLHAVFANARKGAMEMTADLLVDKDPVRTGLREIRDETVRLLDHQVAVERQLRRLTDGSHHGRAEGDVGDEVAVHNINVDDGAATALGGRDLLPEPGKVRRQYGKSQINHTPECTNG